MGLQCDQKIRDFSYHEKEASQVAISFEGNFARELGIEGTYDRAMAERMFRGMRPELVDGKEQRLAQRIDKDRVGAWDWTFNVDKSISTAALVGGDRRIIEAHHEAVKAAMDYVEKNARVRVRKSAELAKPKTYKYPARYTNSLLYDRHVHVSARDAMPHLHTHVRIYNYSKDSVENCVKAVELRFVDREAANDVYRRTLKRGLNQLGYRTTLNGREVALSGFPAEVKAVFSTRHESIKAMEAEYERRAEDFRKAKAAEEGKTLADVTKPLSPKAKSKLSLVDRPDKQEDRPLPERRAEWVAKLTKQQYGRLLGVIEKAKETVLQVAWRAQRKRHVAMAVEYGIQEQTLERQRGLER